MNFRSALAVLLVVLLFGLAAQPGLCSLWCETSALEHHGAAGEKTDSTGHSAHAEHQPALTHADHSGAKQAMRGAADSVSGHPASSQAGCELPQISSAGNFKECFSQLAQEQSFSPMPGTDSRAVGTVVPASAVVFLSAPHFALPDFGPAASASLHSTTTLLRI
ncbi:MAG: hypothetical protein AB7O65_03660 [Candidatus Korobacteraceae bacterium]